MRKVLILAAAVEGATGLGLMILPSMVAKALLGADVNGRGMALGRVCGCALLALGVACWPGPSRAEVKTFVNAVRAMFTYNLLVTIWLVYFRVGEGFAGPLFWPVVILHSGFALLFARHLMLSKVSIKAAP